MQKNAYQTVYRKRQLSQASHLINLVTAGRKCLLPSIHDDCSRVTASARHVGLSYTSGGVTVRPRPLDKEASPNVLGLFEMHYKYYYYS